MDFQGYIHVSIARSLANAAVQAHPPADHPAPYPSELPRIVPPTTEDPAPGQTPRPSSNKKGGNRPKKMVKKKMHGQKPET